MNIVLPKTLAEPWTIPWELIASDDGETAESIKKAMRVYLDTLTTHGWFPGDGVSHFSQEMISMSLRIIVKQGGGLEVDGVYGELIDRDSQKHVAWVYQVFFKTRKGGPQHTVTMRP